MLKTTKEYQALVAKAEQMKTFVMKEAFAQDPERFAKYSLQFEDLFIDYSKNLIDEETMKLLMVTRLKTSTIFLSVTRASGSAPSA